MFFSLKSVSEVKKICSLKNYIIFFNVVYVLRNDQLMLYEKNERHFP